MENDGVQDEKNQLEDKKSRIDEELPTKKVKPFDFHTQFSQKLVVSSFCLFVERKFCIFSHFCERTEGGRDDVSRPDGDKSHFTCQLEGWQRRHSVWLTYANLKAAGSDLANDPADHIMHLLRTPT